MNASRLACGAMLASALAAAPATTPLISASTPDEFGAHIRAEWTKWGKVISSAGLQQKQALQSHTQETDASCSSRHQQAPRCWAH